MPHRVCHKRQPVPSNRTVDWLNLKTNNKDYELTLHEDNMLSVVPLVQLIYKNQCLDELQLEPKEIYLWVSIAIFLVVPL